MDFVRERVESTPFLPPNGVKAGGMEVGPSINSLYFKDIYGGRGRD